METDVIEVPREKVIEEETVIKLEEQLKIEDDEEDFDFFNLKDGHKNKQLVVSKKFLVPNFCLRNVILACPVLLTFSFKIVGCDITVNLPSF